MDRIERIVVAEIAEDINDFLREVTGKYLPKIHFLDMEEVIVKRLRLQGYEVPDFIGINEEDMDNEA